MAKIMMQHANSQIAISRSGVAAGLVGVVICGLGFAGSSGFAAAAGFSWLSAGGFFGGVSGGNVTLRNLNRALF
jgi:hypothetical protein